jgi:hypothetical protein
MRFRAGTSYGRQCDANQDVNHSRHASALAGRRPYGGAGIAPCCQPTPGDACHSPPAGELRLRRCCLGGGPDIDVSNPYTMRARWPRWNRFVSNYVLDRPPRAGHPSGLYYRITSSADRGTRHRVSTATTAAGLDVIAHVAPSAHRSRWTNRPSSTISPRSSAKAWHRAHWWCSPPKGLISDRRDSPSGFECLRDLVSARCKAPLPVLTTLTGSTDLLGHYAGSLPSPLQGGAPKPR